MFSISSITAKEVIWWFTKEMKTLGVSPEINIELDSILGYAAQQEALAAEQNRKILQAVAMLKGTKKWRKDKRLAEIRQVLER